MLENNCFTLSNFDQYYSLYYLITDWKETNKKSGKTLELLRQNYNEFLKETDTHIELAEDEVIDMQMGIEDTLQEYQQTIRKINEILNKKAVENGIAKAAFRGGFKEFNI